MRWHRQTNYHNSRAYAPDRPDKAVIGQLRITFAFLLDAVRGRCEALLRRVRRSSTATVLRIEDGSGFTMLGLPAPDSSRPTTSGSVLNWRYDLTSHDPRKDVPEQSIDPLGGR